MAPSLRLLYSFLFLILCCTSNCGRKRRYPFSFAEKTTSITVSTLDLPCVQNICVTTTQLGNKISWDYTPEQKKQVQIKAQFIGYNIYRLTKNGFIPKQSLNKTPIIKTNFIDTKNRTNNSYIVRTVFKQHDKFIQGPLSRIAKPDKKTI